MLEDIKNHVLHYMILITILVIGFGSILYFSANKTTQLILAGLTSLLYLFWGIIHHYMEDDMNIKVMVEYALIGLLSMTILLTVLLRR